ncbi:NAD(P)H-dependent oxidoreductase [Lacticaseibacillus baoqingensis]|uniref:NAD(P)H-dependent oxidoreductase n=1 Tax=Lacticaseibacillus baoqingensis TaxID=2486013 RepID=A0ABW4E5D9_9LACO|nr:NAD(P)H-dependent oxidoreductase [Lacticaseibacillus baoqingensis]
MLLTAIVGTNADFSYNRLLLQYMQKHFKGLAAIRILEISQLPAFSEDTPADMAVWRFKKAIQLSDGVIFSTPEYDHSIPAALKSAIEWLSYRSDVLKHKPAMVVGTSYGPQASSRAQEHLRQILASPDCDAYTLSGNEILIGNAAKVFVDGNVTDRQVQTELEAYFGNFVKFVDSIAEGEDGMSMHQPYLDDAYITFPTGRLSFREVQQIFSTIPFEIDLIDHNDKFSWFSNKPDREHVRSVREIGETVAECHPPKALPIVMKIIDSFKDGSQDSVSRPLIMHGHRVLIQYFALRDVDGAYLGTIEFTGSVEHILNFYEQGAWSDAASGASQTDSTSGASAHDAPAAEAPADATPKAATDTDSDATSGASQH